MIETAGVTELSATEQAETTGGHPLAVAVHGGMLLGGYLYNNYLWEPIANLVDPF